jgi:hypothetical protein
MVLDATLLSDAEGNAGGYQTKNNTVDRGQPRWSTRQSTQERAVTLSFLPGAVFKP